MNSFKSEEYVLAENGEPFKGYGGEKKDY